MDTLLSLWIWMEMCRWILLLSPKANKKIPLDIPVFPQETTFLRWVFLQLFGSPSRMLPASSNRNKPVAGNTTWPEPNPWPGHKQDSRGGTGLLPGNAAVQNP